MKYSTRQHEQSLGLFCGCILTYFVLCGVARDDHGHDFQSLGAAAQAVDTGDIGALLIHWLHKLNKLAQSILSNVHGYIRHYAADGYGHWNNWFMRNKISAGILLFCLGWQKVEINSFYFPGD